MVPPVQCGGLLAEMFHFKFSYNANGTFILIQLSITVREGVGFPWE
jgi:hypothetical protein